MMRAPIGGVQYAATFVACGQQKGPNQVLCCSNTVLYSAIGDKYLEMSNVRGC
jgi:hypothetical protein